MKVSVITPTFNHAEYLKEAIESVRMQSYDNWEMVIVNNYSTDLTTAVVESFNDQRIKLFNYSNNGIIGASRNYAISKSDGDLIAFLDSDDLWQRDKLLKCIKFLNENQHYGAVCHGLLWIGNGQPKVKLYGPAHRASFDGLIKYGNCIATSAAVVRKSLIQNVGCFSEDSKLVTVEDYDLWIRMAYSGTRFGFIDEILGSYRFHQSNTGTVVRKTQALRYMFKSYANIICKNKFRSFIFISNRFARVEYEAARNYQIIDDCKSSWNHIIKGLCYNPLYWKLYVALLINLYYASMSLVVK